MIPIVHYITLYERYHFFGPPCMYMLWHITKINVRNRLRRKVAVGQISIDPIARFESHTLSTRTAVRDHSIKVTQHTG